jgi:hypothetical protein
MRSEDPHDHFGLYFVRRSHSSLRSHHRLQYLAAISPSTGMFKSCTMSFQIHMDQDMIHEAYASSIIYYGKYKVRVVS